MTVVRVVPFEERHVKAVGAIERESFPAPWSRQMFEAELIVPRRHNTVAVADSGAVIGYQFCMWIIDEMHVNKIAVIEPARRAGIASMLMSEAIEFAREMELKMISLEVRASNAGAIRFYERFAFVRAGVRRRYYPDGEDALLMDLPLV